MEVLFKQYDLIRDRRETLFQYCASFRPLHFVQDLETFGGRSIRYLLVHSADNYLFWLGHFAMLDNKDFTSADTLKNVNDVRRLYNETNDLVHAFLQRYKPDYDEPILNKVPNREFQLSLTPLELFTHVITHEYHHKGQIVAMSRQFGYTPVDTDLIRFG